MVLLVLLPPFLLLLLACVVRSDKGEQRTAEMMLPLAVERLLCRLGGGTGPPT